MSLKIKAGTQFYLPVEIDDAKFDVIDKIEFLFKQKENGDTLKTALWSSTGTSRDCTRIGDEHVIYVLFTREDSYIFKQNDMFFMDTRIHYTDSEENPYTNIVRLRMNKTLFVEGEAVES